MSVWNNGYINKEYWESYFVFFFYKVTSIRIYYVPDSIPRIRLHEITITISELFIPLFICSLVLNWIKIHFLNYWKYFSWILFEIKINLKCICMKENLFFECIVIIEKISFRTYFESAKTVFSGWSSRDYWGIYLCSLLLVWSLLLYAPKRKKNKNGWCTTCLVTHSWSTCRKSNFKILVTRIQS